MFSHVLPSSVLSHALSHVSCLVLSAHVIFFLAILQPSPSSLAGPWGTAIWRYRAGGWILQPLLVTTTSTSWVCCVICWLSPMAGSIFFLIFHRFLLLPWPNHGVPAANSLLHLDRRCKDTFHGSASGSCTGRMTAFVDVTSITRRLPCTVGQA